MGESQRACECICFGLISKEVTGLITKIQARIYEIISAICPN